MAEKEKEAQRGSLRSSPCPGLTHPSLIPLFLRCLRDSPDLPTKGTKWHLGGPSPDLFMWPLLLTFRSQHNLSLLWVPPTSPSDTDTYPKFPCSWNTVMSNFSFSFLVRL